MGKKILTIIFCFWSIFFIGCANTNTAHQDLSINSSAAHVADSLYEKINMNTIELMSHTVPTIKTIDSLTFGYTGINGSEVNYGLATSYFPIQLASYSNIYKKRNFIILPFLTLKCLDKNGNDAVYNEYVFFSKNGKSHIRRRNEQFQNIPFFIQFPSIGLPRFTQFKDLAIYLPIDNDRTFSFLNFLFKANAYIIALLILSIFLLSLLVIISIANNNAFRFRNVKWLKYCTWFMFLIILIPYLTPIILYIKYWQSWKAFFQIKSIWSIVRMEQWIILIVYFVLYFAFKRGNKLQTDQEYTI